MTDVFSVRKRSAIMRKIKSRDTQPEMVVRSIVHRLGFRFRVNQGRLPGNPDIVLKRHKKVIFINGCFWHGHKKCRRSRLPDTNKRFWAKKISGNKERDERQIKMLRRQGWKIMVLWTCEINNKNKIGEKLETYLSSPESEK